MRHRSVAPPLARLFGRQSFYNLMLAQTHGIDVHDRMYLLRMHADRDQYEMVQCSDLREEAKVLLEKMQNDDLAASRSTAMMRTMREQEPSESETRKRRKTGEDKPSTGS